MAEQFQALCANIIAFKDFEGSAVAYTVDALGISIGSLMGSPPVTAYIESGAGISEGMYPRVGKFWCTPSNIFPSS